MIDFVKVPVLGLTEELNDVLEALDTAEVKYVIAGGAIRQVCSLRNRPADDIDIFFYSQADYEKAVNRLDGSVYGHVCVFIKETPVSCILLYKWEESQREDPFTMKLNLIKPETVKFTTVEELISQFDFTVNRIALISDVEALADPQFLEDEEKGELRLKFIHCPISSVNRIAKYTRKGYHCKLKEIVKLFVDWDNRDFTYRENVLKILDESPTEDDLLTAYRLMYRD